MERDPEHVGPEHVGAVAAAEVGPVPYRIGVMKVRVQERADWFGAVVDDAVAEVEDVLHREQVHLKVDLVEFEGPHLLPEGGGYSPLDFLQLGLAEKLERDFHFLLAVTDVDLAATAQSFVLALPSQLTNVGVVSAKRLRPSFWGEKPDDERSASRLAGLALHTIGHLLNVGHDGDAGNAMYDFLDIADLEQMRGVNGRQAETMRRNLPREARERTATTHRWWHALTWAAAYQRSIWGAVLRANPLLLALRMPTMFTAAFSLIIVAFFTAEIWDVASSAQLLDLGVFSLVCVTAATAVLYRAFALRSPATRTGALSESAVTTGAATLLGLVLTVLVFYAGFFALAYFAAQAFFPEPLMRTWPTVDPATGTFEQVKLSLFLAALGALVGSLGGVAERRQVVRQILFLDEET